MRKDRPDVVIGFGGYPSIPALAAAVLLGLPRMIHEQNGVLGRVNRVFAKRVARVACGVWPTDLPAGVQGIHVGNPVRGAVLKRAGASYDPPGDGQLSLLVMGGSQGARILSDVVPEAVAALPGNIRQHLSISHQARAEDGDRVKARYGEIGVNADVQPFFHDVPRRMCQAHLVVSRAGASSIADITVIGRPSILIPFAAAAGDHQTANARGLVAGGAAILIPEKCLDAVSLSTQIASVLENPQAAIHMSEAALSLGVPDATQRLMALVLSLAGKETP